MLLRLKTKDFEGGLLKQETEKWVFLLIKLFWHNPFHLYTPLIALINDLQGQNLNSPHLNGYIMYLKSLPAEKLAMPLTSHGLK